MNDYHQLLVMAVLKHTKDMSLIDTWMQGKVSVKFTLGARQGIYAGNRMLKLDTGGTIDFDPSKVTSVVFEKIIREEDAEVAFREIVGENDELQKTVAKIKAERVEIIDRYERQVGELESELGEYAEREKVFNSKLDALQEDRIGKTKEEDPGLVSEDTVSPMSRVALDGQQGEPALTSETKEKAGIHEPDNVEKVRLTSKDIGTLDVKDLK